MLTLTYDDNRGHEAWAGARARNVAHMQKFKKVLRRRQTYGMAKYNENEAERAKAEGREPRLIVNPDQSRMKFLDAYEFGKKADRGHFHVIVLMESQFDVPNDRYMSNSVKEGLRMAEQVFELPQVYGPRAASRADTLADDPTCYDHRADGNQEWNVWPYGQVRIDNLTHETRDPSGQKVLKHDLDLSPAIDYATKYVVKGMAEIPKGWHWDQKSWNEGQVEEFLGMPRPSIIRSMSQGVGYPYARAYGEAAGNAGVGLPHYRYRIDEIRAPRKKSSDIQYRNKLEASGLDFTAAYQLTEQRRQFEMTGAMRKHAFKAYHRIVTAKLGDTRAEQRGGDGYRRDVYQLETDEHAKLMRSHDYLVAAALQPPGLRQTLPMWEELPAVAVYEDDENGDPKDAPGLAEYRPISDRLIERRADIERNMRAYRLTREWLKEAPMAEAIEAMVSATPLDELDTRLAREKLGLAIVRPKLHGKHKEVFDAAVEQCENGMRESKDDKTFWQWSRRLEAVQTASERSEYDETSLPRDTLAHFAMPSDEIIAKVNSSDDYMWPRLREQLIHRYCVVEYIDAEYRLVDDPSGSRTLLQARAHTKEAHWNYFEATRKRRKSRKTTRWFSREVGPAEVRRVRKGERLLVTASHNDPVFTGARPLSPV